eukprot:TRINITY_DN5849_c0_g1_i1.p1 TRINITY_DN5849_c0_g1~~TRINITY_DN5849_c0_g1_i1.p1  ORF type:complete len:201 (+),score=33.52 TRINITY_DN5849_c0_g1_i1:147-749(+)
MCIRDRYQRRVRGNHPRRMALRGMEYIAAQATKAVEGLSCLGTKLDWFCVNDVVMGGRSSSIVQATPEEVQFSGCISKEGGGFASCRTADAPLAIPSGAAGLDVSYISDQAYYKLLLSTETPRLNWQCALPHGVGPQAATIPFNEFRATVRGRPVEAELDVEKIVSVGVMCSVFEWDGKVREDAPDGEFSFTLCSIEVAG